MDPHAGAESGELPGWLREAESTTGTAIDTLIERERRGEVDRRYYCPLCGMVGRGYDSWQSGDWIVEAHPLQRGHNGRCPGGPIDPVKDKAP